jgi:cell division protein ZapA
MSTEIKPITITILDKEYVVGCRPDEQKDLLESVQFLNLKMGEQKEDGKILGTERIAVMTALNIVHEHLELKRNRERLAEDVGSGITRLHDKITSALRAEKWQSAQPIEDN